MAELWFCNKCGDREKAEIINGKPHVAKFRTGFVGVKLACGHWGSVSKDKV
jgi:hypothetical protein